MTCFDHAIGELDEQRTEDRAKVYPIDQFGVERGNNHTHVRLTLQHFAGIEFDAWSDDRFYKGGRDGFGRGTIDRPIDGDDAGE